MAKSILIVAGETSGDNLAAEIIKQWKKISPNKFSFWGFGGERMKKEGVEILRDIGDLSVIGFWEALVNYKRLYGYLKNLVNEAQLRNISGVVLIDYPGFNLKLASKIKTLGVPVYLVVSPQIWAWNYKRIKIIKKYINGVLCLYRFETEIFHKENIDAYFIGHPIAQKISTFQKKIFSRKTNAGKNIKKVKKIALLPGSRRSEVIRHMPFLLQIAETYHSMHPDIIFEIPSASEKITNIIKSFPIPDYIIIQNQNSYYTLSSSDSAVVCSGTATLECSLFNLPFLLIYQTSMITYMIGKRIIQIPYIGIVNVIAGKFITKEFIQKDLIIPPVVEELEKITFDSAYIKNMKAEFRKIKKEVETPNPDIVSAKLLNSFFI